MCRALRTGALHHNSPVTLTAPGRAEPAPLAPGLIPLHHSRADSPPTFLLAHSVSDTVSQNKTLRPRELNHLPEATASKWLAPDSVRERWGGRFGLKFCFADMTC